MQKFIPLSVPNLKGNELKYVTEAIQTEWVSTAGGYINRFEEAISKYVKTEGAVACQSGTAGLHLALILSKVQLGDEVIVPTLTFIAAVNPIKYIGAEPIFMDCDESFTIDPIKLEKFCTEACYVEGEHLINKRTQKKIKAIVVVHVFGNLAPMEEIQKIADKYHLEVIEDATEALGSYYTEGKYKGRFAGTIGDFGVYSFNGNKIITTGGGGMLLCKCKETLKKAKYLSTQAKDDELNFVHNEIGYNYRMTNVQAALGLAQLEQLESFIHIKYKNYELYRRLLEEVEGLNLIPFNENIRSNYWFYPLSIETHCTPLSIEQWVEELSKYGIQTRPIWKLIHEQKPYEKAMAYEVQQAVAYRKQIINIPCSTNLEEEDIYRVVEALKAILYRGNTYE